MTFKFSVDSDRKIHGSRIDVDYNNFKLNFDYTKQLLPNLTFRFDSEVKKRKYQDYSNLFKNTREDNGYRTGVTFTQKITQSIYAEAKATYERVWSKQEVFAYDKNTYNLSINKSF